MAGDEDRVLPKEDGAIDEPIIDRARSTADTGEEAGAAEGALYEAGEGIAVGAKFDVTPEVIIPAYAGSLTSFT